MALLGVKGLTKKAISSKCCRDLSNRFITVFMFYIQSILFSIWIYYAVFLITTGIVHRIKRAPSYRCKRDRERERDVRRQLSADARAFHFSGSSSSADGEDAEGDSLPYHRKSLGERLYPRVHALQPVSFVVHSFKMLGNIQIRPTCLHHGCYPIQIIGCFIWEATINLSLAADSMGVCTNGTIVISQMNAHMIWIGWQQGFKHVYRRICQLCSI